MAGSISRKMKDDIYEKICEKVKQKGARIVADATGKLLVNVLKYKPFLIKPNKTNFVQFSIECFLSIWWYKVECT